jgi:hypothetical protein
MVGVKLRRVLTLLSLVVCLAWCVWSNVRTLENEAIFSVLQNLPTASATWSNNGRRHPTTRVLIYMATNLSPQHLRYFPCWEAAARRLPLLQEADLLLFSSVVPDDRTLASLRRGFGNRLRVEYYEEDPATQGDLRRQQGAIQAMVRPFEKGWFTNYDWVLRVNPDVLIRDDTWLQQQIYAEEGGNGPDDASSTPTQMAPRVAGLVHNCGGGKNTLASSSTNSSFYKFNTDFTAFRPQALNATCFVDPIINPRDNAEMHMTRGLFLSGVVAPPEMPLESGGGMDDEAFQKKTLAYIPHVEQDSLRCRVLGRKSPVVHHHKLWQACPNFFSATDGTSY